MIATLTDSSDTGVGLTDVLLPVAGDFAVDLVGAVLAGGLSQTPSAVSLFRDTLPVPGLGGGALRSRLGFFMFATWWSRIFSLAR